MNTDKPTRESPDEVLEKYGIDLVARARAGELDPVIGRDEEIRRTIRTLSRKTKNNPVRGQVMQELRAYCRPEILNRIDDVVLFKPLTHKAIEAIVELLVDRLRQRLGARGFGLEIAPAAAEYIARAGFDPAYGARPLKRFLQHELETRIARALISGDIPDGSLLAVDLEQGELVVRHDLPAAAVAA